MFAGVCVCAGVQWAAMKAEHEGATIFIGALYGVMGVTMFITFLILLYSGASCTHALPAGTWAKPLWPVCHASVPSTST